MSEAVVVGDRYQVCRRVGTGAMGRVYLAWDLKLRLWCALKVMAPDGADDPELRARFVHEGRALARLHHPHFVRFFDLVDGVETPYLAMEFCEGGALSDRVARGPLPPRMAAAVIADAASALALAHREGIVHRDLKPQNLLLDRAGAVKVSDFGIARVDRENRLTGSHLQMGTVAYMAPEQAANPSLVDRRADVYALGATLWAVVVGRRPTELVAVAGRAPALALLPGPLRGVVDAATALRLEARTPTMEAFESALREALSVLPLDPAGPPLLVEPRLLPSSAPSVPDLVAEAREFDGTRRPWRPTRTGSAAAHAPTVLLGAATVLHPPAAPPVPAPPRRSSPWLLVLVGAPIVVCAGACAGFTVVGALSAALR